MWWLKYDQRWEALQDKPFRLRGTLIHLCLQYHYASKMAQPPSWFFERDLDTALDQDGAGYPSDVLKAKELLFAYQREYLQEPWTPYAVEEEFQATVGELDPGGPDSSLDDEIVTCRPDLLAVEHDPLTREPFLWVYDYKTSGKNWEFADGRWIMRGGLERWKDDGPYALHWQVLINLLILRAKTNAVRLSHLPVRGFVIQRMTREPDRGLKYHFDRHTLKVPAGPYQQAPRAIRACVARERAIRDGVEKGLAPAPSFWACNTKFGPCDFRDVCLGPTPEERQKILHERYARE
ncbi:conserved hypothetical protein [Virus Rctr197k]|nr:conserved hypothetical protein [Virus Rctr197k]